MKRFLRFVLRTLFSLVALLVLLGLGLGFYVRTDHFRRLVQDKAISTVNESIRGEVSLERIGGTLWGDIVLHDLRVRHQDGEILHLPAVKISYSWRALIRGQLEITRVEAVNPVLRLARDGKGSWNIAEAFSSDNEESSGFTLALKEIVLRQAKIDVALGGAEPKAYHLAGLDLNGRLNILPAGVEVNVREVSSQLKAPEMPEFRVKGALGYQDVSSPPTLTMTGFSVESALSRIRIDGQLADFDQPRFTAKAAVEKLSARDIARFFPDWPQRHDLNGAIELAGPLDALETQVNLAVAGAKVSARLHLNVAQDTPRFHGTIDVANADSRQWLEKERFAGVLSGNIAIKGKGFSPEDIDARGNVKIVALEAAGWSLGDATLKGRIRQNEISVDGSLNGALGGAEWRGQVALTEIPRYEMDIAVRDLDIKKVSPDGGATGGKLNFKGRVKGTGVKLADLNTQAEIRILPSAVGPVKVQQGALSASFADGRIRIARAMLRTADTTLIMTGDFGTDIAQRGTLDYDLRAQNISSWLSLVGESGKGTLALKGRAQGNITALQSSGTAKIADLRIAGVTIEDGNIAFDLTRAEKQSLPAGTLRAALRGVQSGIRLSKLDATVNVAPNESPAIQFVAKAQDQWSRAHALAGDLGWQGNDLFGRLREFSLQLPDGTWKLTQPAKIEKRGENLSFEKVSLRNGAKDFTVDGRVAFPGEQALKFRLNGFPLETLAAFLPEQPKMTGMLAIRGEVNGTAAEPEIAASTDLRDSTIGGQRYAGVAAELVYKNHSARLNLTMRQDSSRTLNAAGALPLALSWHDGWSSEIVGPMDFRVQSSGLSLAFLNAYSGKSVEQVDGELLLDMRVRGALKEPELTGTFRVGGGKLKVIPLGVNVTDIAAAGRMDSNSIGIESLSARAADGTLNGKGALALKNYQADNFKLSLAFNGWPAISSQRYRVETAGNLTIQGTLQAPKVAGDIEIVEARLRPDLAFLEQSATAVKRDESIVIVRGDDPEQALKEKTSKTKNAGGNALFKQMSLNIDLRMPGNLWIRHPDAVTELRGRIRVMKVIDEDINLTGATDIVRGWVGFQGRRFNLSRGRVQFTGGGKIDPSLDIVAEYRLPQYRVRALVGGTAQSPTLRLTSEPQLEQADILALLLFGKPVNALNQSQQTSLQQNALDVTSGFVAAKIGAAVSEALGLNRLGIDAGELDFNGGKIGFGRYIGRDTYVSVSQDVAGERGREVNVEYQIAPDWKFGTSTDTRGSSGAEIIWSKQY